MSTNSIYTAPQGASGATGSQGPSGLIGTWQGTWVSQNYVVSDSVEYNGSSYICTLNTVSNEVPTNNTYWDVVAAQGLSGATGAQGLSGATGATGPAGPAGPAGSGTSGATYDYTNDVANPSYLEGRVFYDNSEKALAVYNSESDMTHQLGQEFIVRVYNNSGAQIDNGKVVYYSGAEGVEFRPTIALADASDVTKAHAAGVATHDIPNGSFGFITKTGVVNDLDTSSFSVGDDVYLSSTSPGNLTATPPSDGVIMGVGHIVKSNATTGRLVVCPVSRRGTNFIGAKTSILTTSSGAWVSRTLSSVINGTVQIVIDNNHNNQSRVVGVRAVGSSVSRTLSIAKNTSVTMNVRTDASGNFEIYSDGADASFWYFGHFE